MFREEDPNSDMPATERIPSVLMTPVFDKGHVLFTDNYYTSPSLACYFLRRGIHLCGTIRTNRKCFPKELVETHVEKSQSVFRKPTNAPNNGILACKFRSAKDKANNKPKVVHMLSTFHQPTLVQIGTDANGNPLHKPSVIRDYNLHMGGVDRVDQQLRKTYKWYRKLALTIIMQMLLNAQKVYQKTTGKKVSILYFLKEVATEWIVAHEFNQPHHVNETITRLTGRHFPVLLRPNPGARDTRPGKRCCVCYAQGATTQSGQNAVRTRYVCYECPSTPPLHIDNCFELYHTVHDYSKQ